MPGVEGWSDVGPADSLRLTASECGPPRTYLDQDPLPLTRPHNLGPPHKRMIIELIQHGHLPLGAHKLVDMPGSIVGHADTLDPAVFLCIAAPGPAFPSYVGAPDGRMQEVQVNVTERTRLERFLDLVDRIEPGNVGLEFGRVKDFLARDVRMIVKPIRDGFTARVFVFVPCSEEMEISCAPRARGEGANHPRRTIRRYRCVGIRRRAPT